MAEGARLESVYTLTGIGGSNPSLSASFLKHNHIEAWLPCVAALIPDSSSVQTLPLVFHLFFSDWARRQVVWRGFSGHWMVFYSAALAILYSAANTVDANPRLTNGHSASPNATYCTRCGQPVLRVR